MPNWSSAPNSWAVSGYSGYARTSLSAVSTLLPRWDWAVIIGLGSRIASSVVEGSNAMDLSPMMVMFVSVVVSLTSPRSSFRSSLRRFGLGLPCRWSTSCSYVASCLFVGWCPCGSWMTCWDGCGSSSHSAVSNSANLRLTERGGVSLLGGGEGRPRVGIVSSDTVV